MGENLLVIGPITSAMKSRDILSSHGISSSIIRTPQGIGFKSCGYSLYIPSGIHQALSILNGSGISVAGKTSVKHR